MHRLPLMLEQRPVTRADCENGPRPCPYVSCKHNLYVDIVSGKVKVNFPIPLDQMTADTCVLDVADRGATTLDVVGAKMNVTRERARQIEAKCMDELRALLSRNSFEQLIPEAPAPERDEPLPQAPPPPPVVDMPVLSRAEVRRAILEARARANAVIYAVARPVLRLHVLRRLRAQACAVLGRLGRAA